MSFEQRAVKQATWFALFRFVTQALSWASTVIIARILVPEDYGLMDMATILTGYAMLFSELGLGSAIIQHQNSKHEEHSALFWFTTVISLFFIVLCFILAYPTAAIFNEPRVIPLTQSVAFIFLFSGLSIVPQSLLRKEIQFKLLGIIEMASTALSCIAMIAIAYLGGGVWTLLLGHIIREFIKCVLSFTSIKWKPLFMFNYTSIKDYIAFGIVVAVSRTFLYLFQKSDRFFAGLFFSAKELGLYSFALLLASMPMDKIISLILQVTYPMFATVQNDKDQFNKMYLSINKVISFVCLPLFAGGFLLGEDIILLIFDEKWVSMVPLFKLLCLAQILVAISSVNNNVHNAKGYPKWGTVFNGVCAVLMSISFYFAAKVSLDSLLIPWFTTFPLIAFSFILFTLKKMELPLAQYLSCHINPFFSTVAMSAIIIGTNKMLDNDNVQSLNEWVEFSLKVCLGTVTYFVYFYIFDREFLFSIKSLLRKK